MVFVGDAAHAPTSMTGRGFGTSLDDAAALARSVHDAYGRGVPDALTAYEAELLAQRKASCCRDRGFNRSFARSA
jgi:2-polyprenyl-6-methoxyphenol hydroxylase-like FAD-dependent oxidoreductase